MTKKTKKTVTAQDVNDALGLYAALALKFNDVHGRMPEWNHTTRELEKWLETDAGKIAVAQVGADYGLED